MDTNPDIDDILISAALRFDGYKYAERRRFNHIAAQKTYEKSRDWSHLGRYQRMAVFFTLQRYLYKWGGDMLSRRSLTWRGFLELFLSTYRYDVPAAYRLPEYYERWATCYVPRLGGCLAAVEKVYYTTQYADVDFIEEEVSAKLRPSTVERLA